MDGSASKTLTAPERSASRARVACGGGSTVARSHRPPCSQTGSELGNFGAPTCGPRANHAREASWPPYRAATFACARG
jgi:hypothetical protein